MFEMLEKCKMLLIVLSQLMDFLWNSDITAIDQIVPPSGHQVSSFGANSKDLRNFSYSIFHVLENP